MKTDSETAHDLPPEEEDNEPREESTSPTQEDPAMRLIVRSQYWGRILKGRLRRSFDPMKPYRVIACQAVLSNEGQFWGCCPHHGKRVLELKEEHLQDHYNHDWDLYTVGSSVAPTYMIHSFFMLPQNQMYVDLDYETAYNGWNFVGTIATSTARKDLRALLQDVLSQNENYGYRYHHAHIEILMDYVFDRETPRTRKVVNAKNRAERFRTEAAELELEGSTSTAGGSTKNASGPTKKHGGDSPHSPPIPQVISNDGYSAGTEVSHSNSNMYAHPSQYFPNGAHSAAAPVQWYPAQPQMIQMQHPSTLSETQQVLQGYPIMPMHGDPYCLPPPPGETYPVGSGPGMPQSYYPGPPSNKGAPGYYSPYY